MIKKIVCVIFFSLFFTINVSAEETDIYKSQLEKSGALEINEALPYDMQKYLHDNEIDLNNYNWTKNFKTENVFSHIWDFVQGGFKKPLISLSCITAVIIINSLLFAPEKTSLSHTVNYSSTIAIAGIITAPIIATITTALNSLKAFSAFMTAFVPVFAATTAAAGKPATAVSAGGMLLGGANAVSLIANFIVLPLIGGYLSLSLAASVSPIINSDAISSAIKKLSLWVMSLVCTIFVGVLSIQTTINSAADNLSMRTAKFIIGSTVPVAGGVLSEAMGTLTASVSLLKSSVGIYGVIIICLFFFPIIIELLLWRCSLWAGTIISKTFSVSKISGLLEALDTVLSVLLGVVLLTGAMFIISLSVVIGSKV